MFLQALYQFAKKTKARHGKTLLESPEFNSRYISWLIDIKSDGEFIGFIPLMSEDAPGLLFEKLPRTMEPKDTGTIAEFLVEDVSTIFGIGDASGKPMKDKAHAKYENYWGRIESAAKDLNHPALQSILRWKQNVLRDTPISNPVYELYQKPGGRTQAKEQWLVITSTGNKLPLYFRPNVSIDATFRIDGEVIARDNRVLGWWSSWFSQWIEERENACWAAHGRGRVCVLSGDTDAPISNSHLPKIKGRIFQSFGATIASSEAASFHSYNLSQQEKQIPGTRTGPDASYTNISVKAAIAYCNSLNYLLETDDYHTFLGPIGVCVWEKTNEVPDAPKHFKSLLSKAHPEMVDSFLRAPFAGIDREVLHRDKLYTVALIGNAGRVVVCHWMDQTLGEAIAHFKRWWENLQIVNFYQGSKKTKDNGNLPSPYAIPNLVRATLRKTKGQKDDKLTGERIIQLYRAAMEGTSLPITMLKSILDEFHSALVKNDEKKPTYPYSQSRFALIKLILIRNNNRKEEFMPEYQLTDTNDSSYNLGCLLAVLEALQKRSMRAGRAGAEQGADKPNAGIIERYYGQASTAPAFVFPYLLSLSRHHLSKLSKGNEKDKRSAKAIEETIINICKKFKPNPEVPGDPPKFPRLLDLERQGRFALGFYQQKAYDIEQARKYRASQGRDGLDIVDIDESGEVDGESVE